MKILSAEAIRDWDQYTITHEPISSIDLMERAALACVDWLQEQQLTNRSFTIFCGKGNNGGDGLAIARLLARQQVPVSVYILEFGHLGTADFQANLERLHKIPSMDIHFIQTEEQFHPLEKDTVVIDALFGSGLNRSLEGVTAKLVDHINKSGCTIISIDIASGLFVDKSSIGNSIVTPAYTLSFQCYKPAFLFAENEKYTGDVQILDIGLHHEYLKTLDSNYELLDDEIIHALFQPRKSFSHKGHFGHALLVAGSYGKMGAAVLAARACMRSGVGLLSCHIPQCGYNVLQISIPEAMVLTDFNSSFITKIDDDLTKYDAIGIGPGLGTASETTLMLHDLLQTFHGPLVIDADGLNGIAKQEHLLKMIPAGSILTPHPKEFERMFGKSANDFERAALASQKAQELKVVMVLKGHHTLIALPNGSCFFNSTGNAGMATAGSGDVLTGILTGLLAQGYKSSDAAMLGTYLHGRAGDIAARRVSMESLIASDIIEQLGAAFQFIY